jgi:universal stress protein A
MLRLLVALDFSDCSRLALETALKIADLSEQTELVLLTVLDPLSEAEAQTEGALSEMERSVGRLHAMVEEIFKTLPLRRTSASHPPRMHYTATRGAPADEIIKQSTVHRVDAIVMGTHGRTGLNRIIAGSVAETVVRHAPCSVLSVKPKKTT